MKIIWLNPLVFVAKLHKLGANVIYTPSSLNRLYGSFYVNNSKKAIYAMRIK